MPSTAVTTSRDRGGPWARRTTYRNPSRPERCGRHAKSMAPDPTSARTRLCALALNVTRGSGINQSIHEARSRRETLLLPRGHSGRRTGVVFQNNKPKWTMELTPIPLCAQDGDNFYVRATPTRKQSESQTTNSRLRGGSNSPNY